jgi:hypothetical protein
MVLQVLGHVHVDLNTPNIKQLSKHMLKEKKEAK